MPIPIPPQISLDDNLANGRGMTSCEIAGISGWCGADCPALLAYECENEEMIEMYQEVQNE